MTEWRGSGGADLPQPPEWWPGDMPLWRALVRAGPVGAIEAVFVSGGFLVSVFESSPLTSVLDVLFQVLVVVTIGLMVLVGLFNRPAWAVAPQFRNLPGALEEWRGVAATPPNPRRDHAEDRPPRAARPAIASRWAPWWAYLVPILAINSLRQLLVPPAESAEAISVALFAATATAVAVIVTIGYRSLGGSRGKRSPGLPAE